MTEFLNKRDYNITSHLSYKLKQQSHSKNIPNTVCSSYNKQLKEYQSFASLSLQDCYKTPDWTNTPLVAHSPLRSSRSRSKASKSNTSRQLKATLPQTQLELNSNAKPQSMQTVGKEYMKNVSWQKENWQKNKHKKNMRIIKWRKCLQLFYSSFFLYWFFFAVSCWPRNISCLADKWQRRPFIKLNYNYGCPPQADQRVEGRGNYCAGQPHQDLTSSPFLMPALPLCMPNSSINCH